MSTNRIQKLIFSEYCDFEDMVLLESPFAETTRDGRGIRQVQMGLTPTKLILATDILKAADDEIGYAACLEAGKIGLDPEIESLELVSVYPVEAVNLSVFRKKKRNTLKAHFCNDLVLYFELGGIIKRQMFWNLWRERVKFLSPNDGSSSLSETSVGSSSSVSTLYIADSRLAFSEGGKAQLFFNYNAIIPSPTRLQPNLCGWKDKNLYLGPHFPVNDRTYDNGLLYSVKCKNNLNNGCNLMVTRSRSKSDMPINNLKVDVPVPVRLRSASSASVLEHGPSCMYLINRFGYGVPENTASLYLQQNVLQEEEQEFVKGIDLYDIVESGVATWEQCKHKHLRRYAFAPQPHFLHGLGPWKVSPGEAYSVQIKKAVSMVNIRRQPTDCTFRLPISRRQLTTTISCEALDVISQCNPAKLSCLRCTSPTSPVIFFWTPDYWYRPRSASSAYNELLVHLKSINKMHGSPGESDHPLSTNMESKKGLCNKLRGNQASNGLCSNVKDSARCRKIEGTSKLRRLLKLDEAFSVWQFDSLTLAYQLTMIDRALFLKIPRGELATLIWQQSSKFAPNVGAVIAFSHRISCLVATEIIKETILRKRARLVARFINLADKCHRLKNYQSTRSILCGLQSPPVYRLKETWTYVRHHHATKYQRLETLSRRYKDPRLPTYQQMFRQGSVNPPYLPSVAHIVYLLLDRLEQFPENVLVRHSPSSDNKSCNINQGWRSFIEKATIPKSFQRILSAFRIWPSSTQVPDSDSQSTLDGDDVSIQSLFDLKLSLFFNSLYFDENSTSTKVHHLQQVFISFETWQKASSIYALQENNKAYQYLLKARYREDRENFFESIKLEPTVLKSEE